MSPAPPISPAARLARAAARLPSRGLLALLWLYRRLLSPALHALAGPGAGCRFHPTCSCYAAEAVRAHGAVTGAWLAVRRLARCHPFSPGGADPLPPSVSEMAAGGIFALRPPESPDADASPANFMARRPACRRTA
jgi:putative membrane protein insertion efficiency factor